MEVERQVHNLRPPVVFEVHQAVISGHRPSEVEYPVSLPMGRFDTFPEEVMVGTHVSISLIPGSKFC